MPRGYGIPAPAAFEVARLEGEGFHVVAVDDASVALERRNSRATHLLGALIGGLLGGGINPSPRIERVWMHLHPDGSSATRLFGPRDAEARRA